jgi:hypothetical protein
MQGISPIQPLFSKICLENRHEFSRFAGEFPTQTSREFFCRRRELIRASRDEQGIRAKSYPPADMPNLE